MSLGLRGKYTRFECSFKPGPIPHDWRILAKQSDPNWSPYDLSAPLSLCRSHMIGAFSQNRVTLTGLPMISLSESDLTYPLALDRRLQEDWARDAREGPRVLMSLRTHLLLEVASPLSLPSPFRCHSSSKKQRNPLMKKILGLQAPMELTSHCEACLACTPRCSTRFFIKNGTTLHQYTNSGSIVAYLDS
ncbi:hypothetical protein HKD37_16G045123 [Glycine soja]